jgi:hypothetical protein
VVATATIIADVKSGTVLSESSDWPTARDGTDATGKGAFTDQQSVTLGTGLTGSTYRALQAFLWFDVDSAIPDDALIISATLSMYPHPNSAGLDAGVYIASYYNWGDTLVEGNFRTGSRLQALDNLATMISPWTPGQQNLFTSLDAFTDLDNLNPFSKGCHLVLWGFPWNANTIAPTEDHVASFEANSVLWPASQHPTLTIGYEVDAGFFGSLF